MQDYDMDSAEAKLAYAGMFFQIGWDDFATVHIVDPVAFASRAHRPDHVHDRFGYTAPALVRGRFHVWVCPEMIVSAAAHLGEREFHDYLLWIQSHLALHIAYHDDPDVEARVDSELGTKAAACSQMVIELRERYLRVQGS